MRSAPAIARDGLRWAVARIRSRAAGPTSRQRGGDPVEDRPDPGSEPPAAGHDAAELYEGEPNDEDRDRDRVRHFNLLGPPWAPLRDEGAGPTAAGQEGKARQIGSPRSAPGPRSADV